ncbi:MAG: nucleoside deaminase [bacterium]
MLPQEKFMLQAIAAAKHSKETTGCGVVIVKNDHVLAETYNLQHENHDATAHAEILAIRQAGEKAANKKLPECVAYCTTEPCIMCLAAMSYAKIAGIVFGLTMKETYPVSRIIDLTDITGFIAISPHKFWYQAGFLKEQCRQLIDMN